MPRKSTKPAEPTLSRGPIKRAAPATPSRQSKRAKSGTRTSYAEPDSDDDLDKPTASPSDEDSTVQSDYEHESVADSPSDSDQLEAASEEDSKAAKTLRGRSAKRSTLPMHTKKDGGEELWKSGAKLELGTQVIIKKPKARDAGDTPFTNETIHPNTMLFLSDLAAHNDRQWLKAHDADYRTSLQDFTTFLESLSEKVIEADETIPELPVKDIIFRIYRDVRFSKDQTPYKTHFSAAWSRTGRKGPYAAYYVQIQPNGSSFVGGGLWMPDARSLSALRQDIDRKPHKIKRVLTDANIRKSFLGGIPEDEKKAVKAFTNQSSNRSNALKKHPKGYDSDHKDIDLLRLRNFTLGTKLSDNEVVGANGLDRIAEIIGCMVPFITYLNSVVMPDEDSSDSSEENGEESASEVDGNDA
ncbi:uncharacterized protein CC84DRAFT_1165439 [Paraphaeosphaeria sporulosa]|uniref:Uncharacterized protein n=1 Tax=Paraphaeosphaeria sporulosa TaxID=1460663 RepID=A0A177CEE6_9PLEO|nr:uncharacterized protein CC84DRAFT_1165439 [Paraphaeosphaeria sporulosa]OAG05110.1 hypothetical protein CC84DRAFT_1165439 [Paraphaeosphaeria sporulosa]